MKKQHEGKNHTNEIKNDIGSLPSPFLISFLTDSDFTSISEEVSDSDTPENEEQGWLYWEALESALQKRKVPYLEDLTDEEYKKSLNGALSQNDYKIIQNRCYPS